MDKLRSKRQVNSGSLNQSGSRQIVDGIDPNKSLVIQRLNQSSWGEIAPSHKLATLNESKVATIEVVSQEPSLEFEQVTKTFVSHKDHFPIDFRKDNCTSMSSGNERQSTHMRDDSFEPKSAEAFIGDADKNVTARGWVMGESTPSVIND